MTLIISYGIIDIISCHESLTDHGNRLEIKISMMHCMNCILFLIKFKLYGLINLYPIRFKLDNNLNRDFFAV